MHWIVLLVFNICITTLHAMDQKDITLPVVWATSVVSAGPWLTLPNEIYTHTIFNTIEPGCLYFNVLPVCKQFNTLAQQVLNTNKGTLSYSQYIQQASKEYVKPLLKEIRTNIQNTGLSNTNQTKIWATVVSFIHKQDPRVIQLINKNLELPLIVWNHPTDTTDTSYHLLFKSLLNNDTNIYRNQSIKIYYKNKLTLVFINALDAYIRTNNSCLECLNLLDKYSYSYNIIPQDQEHPITTALYAKNVAMFEHIFKKNPACLNKINEVGSDYLDVFFYLNNKVFQIMDYIDYTPARKKHIAYPNSIKTNNILLALLKARLSIEFKRDKLKERDIWADVYLDKKDPNYEKKNSIFTALKEELKNEMDLENT